MANEFEKRVHSESMCTLVIKQSQLWCGDCKSRHEIHRAGDISSCERFKEKPNQVLIGGECPEYQKQR